MLVFLPIPDFKAQAMKPCKKDKDGFIFTRYCTFLRVIAAIVSCMCCFFVIGSCFSLFIDESKDAPYILVFSVSSLILMLHILFSKYKLTDTALIYGILVKKTLPLDMLREAARENPPYITHNGYAALFSERGKITFMCELFFGGYSFMSQLGKVLGVEVKQKNLRERPSAKALIVMWAIVIAMLYSLYKFTS